MNAQHAANAPVIDSAAVFLGARRHRRTVGNSARLLRAALLSPIRGVSRRAGLAMAPLVLVAGMGLAPSAEAIVNTTPPNAPYLREQWGDCNVLVGAVRTTNGAAMGGVDVRCGHYWRTLSAKVTLWRYTSTTGWLTPTSSAWTPVYNAYWLSAQTRRGVRWKRALVHPGDRLRQQRVHRLPEDVRLTLRDLRPSLLTYDPAADGAHRRTGRLAAPTLRAGRWCVEDPRRVAGSTSACRSPPPLRR